jgi:hypothetical protein
MTSPSDIDMPLRWISATAAAAMASVVASS